MGSDKKGAEQACATIVFVDESGLTQRPSVRRTWSPRGVTPIIYHHFNWKRINSIGAIACKPDGSDPELLLHMQKATVNSQSIITFLSELHRDIAGPIILLWDGLPAHRSLVVKDHIEKHKDWLTVERLPAYAPELNAVEYLWSTLKGKDVANLCSDTLEEIEQKLEEAAVRIRDTKSILKGFLTASTLFA